jgi:hypothetical protein
VWLKLEFEFLIDVRKKSRRGFVETGLGFPYRFMIIGVNLSLELGLK